MGLGSPFTISLYKRHVADEDLSIPELSPRSKRNRRKLCLQLAESMVQLWLAEWKWLLTINLYSIYNSSDQRRFFLARWNAITVRNGRGKGQFWGNKYKKNIRAIWKLRASLCKILISSFGDVTKTGNGERGAGNGERKSGNELSAETPTKIQNGGPKNEREKEARFPYNPIH